MSFVPNKQGDAEKLFPSSPFILFFILSAGDIDNTWKAARFLLFTAIVPTGEKQSISTITFFCVAKTLALKI